MAAAVTTRPASFAQVPLAHVIARADEGRKVTEDLLEFVKERVSAEDKVASSTMRSARSNAYSHEINESTLQRALGNMKNYTITLARHHTALARASEAKIRDPLAALKARQTQLHKQCSAETQRAVREVRDADDKLAKARQRLRKTRDDAAGTVAKTTAAPPGSDGELSRLVSKCSRLKRDEDAAKAAVRTAEVALWGAVCRRDEVFASVTDAYQRAEEERLDATALALARFIELERQHLQAREHNLDMLEQVFEQVSREADVQTFVAAGRLPEKTHLSHKALALLDWDWRRTHDDDALPEHALDTLAARMRDHVTRVTAEAAALRAAEAATQARADAVRAQEAAQTIASQVLRTADGAAQADPNRVAALTRAAAAAEEAAVAAAGAAEERDAAARAAAEQQAANEAARQPQPPEPPQESQEDIALRAQMTAFLDVLWSQTELSDDQIQSTGAAISELLATKRGRELFLQELNHRRSVQTDVGRAFEPLADCMLTFLDVCALQNDVVAAKMLMVMSETFYRAEGGEADDRGAREYTQGRLLKHSIWRNPQFWEDALLEGIAEEFDRSPQDVRWQELDPRQRDESVVRVHNTIFGQLGSIVFNMLEFGVPVEEARDFLTRMADNNQLAEDQLHIVLGNLESAALAAAEAAAASAEGGGEGGGDGGGDGGGGAEEEQEQEQKAES